MSGETWGCPSIGDRARRKRLREAGGLHWCTDARKLFRSARKCQKVQRSEVRNPVSNVRHKSNINQWIGDEVSVLQRFKNLVPRCSPKLANRNAGVVHLLIASGNGGDFSKNRPPECHSVPRRELPRRRKLTLALNLCLASAMRPGNAPISGCSATLSGSTFALAFGRLGARSRRDGRCPAGGTSRELASRFVRSRRTGFGLGGDEVHNAGNGALDRGPTWPSLALFDVALFFSSPRTGQSQDSPGHSPGGTTPRKQGIAMKGRRNKPSEPHGSGFTRAVSALREVLRLCRPFRA